MRRQERNHRRPTPKARAAGGTPSEASAERLAMRLEEAALFLCAAGAALGLLFPSLSFSFRPRMVVSVLLLSSGALWALSMAVAGRVELRGKGLWGPGLFLGLVMAASCVMAVSLRPALIQAVLWVSYVVAFLVAAHCARPQRGALVLVATVGACLAIVTMHGIHQSLVSLPETREQLLRGPREALRLLGLPMTEFRDLEGRLNSRVMGTFLLPNSLAGFIVLAFPMALGLVADQWREKRLMLSREHFLLNGFFLVGMLLCLFLTRSKGGWIAFAAAMVFFAARAEEWLRRRLGKQALLALAGLAVVAIIAQQARLAPPLADYKGSMEGRLGYWKGAVRIVAQHPLFGVGGGNFPEAYSSVKRPSDEETRYVHNDYLQVAVEMGVFGLLGYLALWWRFWRLAARRGPEPSLAADDWGGWWAWALSLGAVVFGLALLFGFAPGSDRSAWRQGWPLALALGWVSMALLNLRPAARVCLTPRSFAMAGVQAGLAGFLVHGLADFDLYVHGLAETAAVLAGVCVAAATAGREDEVQPRRLGSTGRLALAAGGLAALLGFWWGLGERLVLASAFQEDAMNATLDLRDVDRIKKLEAAARLDPLDDTTQARLADLYWFRRGDMEKALHYAQEAARLSPARSEHYARLSRLYLESYARTRLPDALQLAYGRMRRAVSLFPSFPALRVELALISQLEGRPSEALDHLREALRLNRDQYHHVRRKLASEVESAVRERVDTIERELRAHPRGAEELRPPEDGAIR